MPALITTHPNADFDGLAAMVAARHLYPEAILAFSGSAEAAVRRFVADHLPIPILNPRQVDLSQVDTLVLCDGGSASRAGHFEALATQVPFHIFDHHPVDSEDDDNVVRVVESVGATATLMSERLRADGIQPAPWECTLLTLAIHEETGSFTHASTTARDLQAAAWLLDQGVDTGVLRTYLASPLNRDQITLLDELAHRLEIRYINGLKLGVATAHTEDYVPEVAGLANRLLRMEPMDAVVIAVAMADKVILVARGTQPNLPLHQLAQKFGGGGHPTAASATLHDTTEIEGANAVWAALAEVVAPLRCARDLMTRNPITVDRDVPLKEVEPMLTRAGVNAMPVTCATEDVATVGVVTRESVQRALAHGLGELPVADVMEPDPFTVKPETPFDVVRDHMATRNLRFVPVVDGPTLCGCITRTDLVRAMHADLRVTEGIQARHDPQRQNVSHQLARLPDPVQALLRDAGALGKKKGCGVFLAGGMVRDLLLAGDSASTSLDVDLVVEGDAIPFARAWAHDMGAHVHVHGRFGTATLVLSQPGLPDSFKVDLASARSEFYAYPTALPTVSHGSLKKDLYRRDFTMNALAVDLDPERYGTLLDYFGGERDLRNGHIRVLHTLSFVDDPTRALRAARFAVRFGFDVCRQTAQLMQGALRQGLFHKLSGKRLQTELRYLLGGPDPAAAVNTLSHMGLLTAVHPDLGEAPDGARLRRLNDAVAWYRLTFPERPLEGWLVYLRALADPLPAERRDALWHRLDLAGRVRTAWAEWNDLPERVATVREPGQGGDGDDCDGGPGPLPTYRRLHGAPPELVVHLMGWVTNDSLRQSIRRYLSDHAHLRPLINGNDLQAQGIPVGPRYRMILDAVLAAQVDGTVHSPAEALALAKRLAHAP